jgi:hypothetical protein
MSDPTIYDELLSEIKKDPEAFIREKRLHQIAALKLYFPDKIHASRKLRRYHWDSFEQAVKEVKKREVEVAFLVKHERDGATNKLKYPNRESREAEIQDRLNNDAAHHRWENQRASMYASVKQFDDQIDYFERMDTALTEILAMFTALIEYETRNERKYTREPSNRTANRSKQRARVAAGATENTALPA